MLITLTPPSSSPGHRVSSTIVDHIDLGSDLRSTLLDSGRPTVTARSSFEPVKVEQYQASWSRRRPVTCAAVVRDPGTNSVLIAQRLNHNLESAIGGKPEPDEGHWAVTVQSRVAARSWA